MEFKYKDLELYKQMHKNAPSYGATGGRYIHRVIEHIEKYKPETILDFGCGKGCLKNALKMKQLEIDEYDPAIKGKEKILKDKYDLIITTDVLEHLYEEEIEQVCKEFLSLSPETMFHVICTRKADALLPDGSNAHKTVKPIEWWKQKMESYLNYRALVVKNPADINQTETSIMVLIK